MRMAAYSVLHHILVASCNARMWWDSVVKFVTAINERHDRNKTINLTSGFTQTDLSWIPVRVPGTMSMIAYI